MDETCDLLCLDLPHAEAVRTALPPAPSLESAAARAKALGEATRLRIALALATGGPMCGCDLAWVTGLAANLVSHHARVLRACGLAASRRDGKLVVYQLTPLGLVLLDALGVHPAAAGAPADRHGHGDVHEHEHEHEHPVAPAVPGVPAARGAAPVVA